MGVDTTWTDPSTSGAIDLSTGGILTETIYDKILSNLKRLGGTAGLIQLTNAGLLLINDTANANMDIGITIQQGAFDTEGLALKSSVDVAHGMTTLAETDTYATFKKWVAADGGLAITGLSDANRGVAIQGAAATAADTAKTTSAVGVVNLLAAVKSGTDWGAVGADGNLVVVGNHTTIRYIFDAEGTLHSIGATTTERFGDGNSLLVSPIINTPSASGHVFSTTYTPTLSNLTNISGTPTAYLTSYARLGTLITGAGKFTATPTSGTSLCLLDLSLPVASAFANDYEASGAGGAITGASDTPDAVLVLANAITDQLRIRWYPGTTDAHDVFFHFAYRII